MENRLVFHKIIKDNIFQSDFENFQQNNEIEFKSIKDNNIAVIYAPNGTGKTSLTKVLSNRANGEFSLNSIFSLSFNGVEYNQDNNELFYIINDQISRNIVPGKTEDFLLGDNIRREFELKENIDSEFERLFKTDFPTKLKDEYLLSKVTNLILNKISNIKLREYVKDIVNNRSRGDKIDREEFLYTIYYLEEVKLTLDEIKENKLKFLFANYLDKHSLIFRLMNINQRDITKNESVEIIEENETALFVLNKYQDKSDCIVCDNKGIDSRSLINRKIASKEKVFNELNDKTKEILIEIINKAESLSSDPLNIKDTLQKCIKLGNTKLLLDLQEEIKELFSLFDISLTNLFVRKVKESFLYEKYEEYQKMLKEQPEITDEEMGFIQRVISDHLGKSIEIKRDNVNGNNFKLLLDDNELLGVDRNKLHLSTGEQNFISLAFELLLAKKSSKEIIILDDPISSFDSIYKNKIAYSLVKFLEGKKQLILTHNTDLIKLLESQLKGCFNLYILNNTENGKNGFIRINENEKLILLDLSKLLNFFRKNVFLEIVDEKRFVMSMIPFMRGYANIIGNSAIYKKLSQVMHGYGTAKINISQIYNELFSIDETNKIQNDYIISVNDILNDEYQEVIVLNSSNYPLLNHTLCHSLMYLYLRLKVENSLIKICNIEVGDGDILLLHKIIMKAFNFKPGDTDSEKKQKNLDRVFFTSRKTLLNEFNHFEGNMNIFQPAIDITDAALYKEKDDILNYLREMESRQDKKIPS